MRILRKAHIRYKGKALCGVKIENPKFAHKRDAVTCGNCQRAAER
jgi:hypothetical protein